MPHELEIRGGVRSSALKFAAAVIREPRAGHDTGRIEPGRMGSEYARDPHRAPNWWHFCGLGILTITSPEGSSRAPTGELSHWANAMDVIDLQSNARPRVGSIEHYWFENAHTGLRRTRFHRICIPFDTFDSGLDFVSQPESTELVVEWINLGLADPSDLDGVVIAMGVTPDVEASIYLGGAHNLVDIWSLRVAREGAAYRISCDALVDFESQGVAKNEPFSFQAMAEYCGEA